MFKPLITYLFYITTLTLALCSCTPPKKVVQANHSDLESALANNNLSAIQKSLGNSNLNNTNRQLVYLYTLLLQDRHHNIVDQSKNLISRYNQLTSEQKKIATDILSWAYARKIYRQETAQQVRLFQREQLLLAPSNIDFSSCLNVSSRCANQYRSDIATIISGPELNKILSKMAAKDPCINLSTTDKGGDTANKCLASRKGNLKVTLLQKPRFSRSQWASLF